MTKQKSKEFMGLKLTETFSTEKIDKLENGDLIFARFSELHPRRDHVMIYHELEDSSYNIIHLLFSGVQRDLLQEYIKERETGEYTVIRFVKSIKGNILGHALNILTNCDAVQESHQARVENYNFYRYCAYNLLPAAYEDADKKKDSKEQQQFENFNRVQEFCAGNKIALAPFFGRKLLLKRSDAPDEKANARQYYKYATTYYGDEKQGFTGKGRLTCSQFVLFCLVMPGILSLVKGEKYKVNCKITDKKPSMNKLENGIINAYFGKEKGWAEGFRGKQLVGHDKQSKELLDLPNEKLKKLTECLGPFAKLNPKTVITEELYLLLSAHFSSLFVERRGLSREEIIVRATDGEKSNENVPSPTGTLE